MSKALWRNALLLVLLSVWPVSATCASPIPQPAMRYVNALGQAGFSGSVLVARKGQVFIRSFGYADREFWIRNAATTKFRIGSLTKQFTAMGVLLLVKDGKISLDDPICKFIDGCPQRWQPITVRELLNHSDGIPDFVKLDAMKGRFTLPMKLGEMISLLKRQPLQFAPGTDAEYGNSGFLISAAIIERLSGKSYADFLKERIYQPLGMKESGYAADEPIIPGRARGYVSRDGTLQNAAYIDMSIPVGAGSQYSTVVDLYRWDRALRGDRLLPARLRQEMFAPGKGDFGLGWEMSRAQGRRIAQHVGDINGFGAYIVRWLDDDAVVVILTNVEGTKRVVEIRNDIAKLLMP